MKKDEFIAKILQDIDNINNNFSDKGNRQIFFSHFKDDIDALWNLFNEDDCSKEIVIILADSIKNINIDDFNYEQFGVIKNIIEEICKGNITEDKIDFYIEYLIEKDIPLVRLPANISDLYD
jgi:hypothetical protein